MQVLLIGPRGSGKSATGRWLAEHLARPFVDLDDRVLARFSHSTVSAVWDAHGESAWREAEVAELEKILMGPGDDIVALGGGVPMIPAARALIEQAQHRERVYVLYLRTSPNTLRKRLLQNPGDRPSLTGEDTIAEIERVLDLRDPTYEALADCICDTDECTTTALGVIILAELRYHGVARAPHHRGPAEQ